MLQYKSHSLIWYRAKSAWMWICLLGSWGSQQSVMLHSLAVLSQFGDFHGPWWGKCWLWQELCTSTQDRLRMNQRAAWWRLLVELSNIGGWKCTRGAFGCRCSFLACMLVHVLCTWYFAQACTCTVSAPSFAIKNTDLTKERLSLHVQMNSIKHMHYWVHFCPAKCIYVDVLQTLSYIKTTEDKSS